MQGKLTLLTLFISFFVNNIALPQQNNNLKYSLGGAVKDSVSGKSLEYPTVVLIDDSLKIVSAVAGGADGRFLITDIKYGNYTIVASMLGYSTVKRKLQINGNQRRVETAD